MCVCVCVCVYVWRHSLTLQTQQKWIINGGSLTCWHDGWLPAVLPFFSHLLALTRRLEENRSFVPSSGWSSILHEIICFHRGDMWRSDPLWQPSCLNFITPSHAADSVLTHFSRCGLITEIALPCPSFKSTDITLCFFSSFNPKVRNTQNFESSWFQSLDPELCNKLQLQLNKSPEKHTSTHLQIFGSSVDLFSTFFQQKWPQNSLFWS